MNDKDTVHGPLGKKVSHSSSYDPGHLFPIKRELARRELQYHNELPFTGIDIWNAYELSWLDGDGLPHVAVAEIRIDAASLNIIESKSVKLYLNSFNQSRFKTIDEVKQTLRQDISEAVSGEVGISLVLPQQFNQQKLDAPKGVLLDTLQTVITKYTPEPEFLGVDEAEKSERLYSHLLRTKCPVTDQPDWATVLIDYTGKAIDREGLLRYIVSFRQHTGFHENCIERIYMDIWQRCRPKLLTVRAQFTRRGGIDINPIRTNTALRFKQMRLFRQ